ncbi:hypothetical protein N7493_000983 [Penicillium malachiteum]|uniref:Uncharacterized protein n=1 Tax=Penicillium malachiteum TaxID=1324776 RepID=A0AAD6HXX9_9EURO|nr:hypothetical protein N7493_000983 [Penicillium malachiteum]
MSLKSTHSQFEKAKRDNTLLVHQKDKAPSMDLPGEHQTKLSKFHELRRKMSKSFFNATNPEQNESPKNSDPLMDKSDQVAAVCVKVVTHEFVPDEKGLVQPLYTLEIKENGESKQRKLTTEGVLKLQNGEEMLRIYFPRLTEDIQPHLFPRSLAPGEEHTLKIKASTEGGKIEYLGDGRIILRGVDIIYV